MTRGFPNGATRRERSRHPPEGGGEPGELKHLSTRRKRKQTSDSASSGERKRRSPNRGRREAPRGVVGPPLKRPRKASGTGWKAGPERVKAPYAKAGAGARRHLSKPGHEESWPNPRGPSRKAKHYRETDSEPVPRGKGEKDPEQGSERDPEIMRPQAVGAAQCRDGVPFA